MLTLLIELALLRYDPFLWFILELKLDVFEVVGSHLAEAEL